MPTRAETRDSYLAWWKYAAPPVRRRERWAGRGLAVASLVGLIVVAIADFSYLGVLVLTCLLLGGICLATDQAAVGIMVRRHEKLLDYSEITTVADDSGIRWSRAGEEHRYAWDAVQKVVDTGELVLVSLGDRGFLCIPRDALGEQGTAALLALSTRPAT